MFEAGRVIRKLLAEGLDTYLSYIAPEKEFFSAFNQDELKKGEKNRARASCGKIIA